MAIAATILQLIKLLNAQNVAPKIVEAAYYNSGVDADIFILSDAEGAQYALKKSRDNFFDNANDINQNDSQLFRQEAAFAKLINASNVTFNCPKTIFCHDEFLVMEFIKDDGMPISDNAIVDILSQLHNSTRGIELSSLPIGHEGHNNIAQTLADRMLRRIKNLNEFLKIDFSWLNRQLIVDIVKTDNNENCLLHMDLRRNNLLQNKGDIYLIDWANTLVGSPLLELARLEVYGESNSDLLANYITQNNHVHMHNDAYNIYLLGTAIMMNLVFLSSAPNKKMATIQEAKLHTIIKSFL